MSNITNESSIVASILPFGGQIEAQIASFMCMSVPRKLVGR